MKLLLRCLTALLLSSPQAYAQTLPRGALQHGPVLKEEYSRLWPTHPNPLVLFGQVEKETCISLTHSKCWTPNAKLETKREYGFSFGQFTVAYNADGTERFNVWKELKARHSKELADWSWENRLDPRLGLRAVVLYDYQIFRNVQAYSPHTVEALRFSLAAYNGGTGGLLSDIKLCKARLDCDPHVWYSTPVKLGVSATSNKSRVKWQGYGLSAFEINRGYVSSIEQRAPKYRTLVE